MGPSTIDTQEPVVVKFNNDAQRKQWLDEMKGKSLSIILEDCNMLIIQMQLKDKRLVMQLKHVGINDQGNVVAAKVGEYNKFQKWAVAVSGGFGLVSAYCGQNAWGVAHKVGGELAGHYKNQADSQSQGVHSQHDHSLQTKYSVSKEYGDRLSRANQNIDQSQNTIAQAHAAFHRMMESVLSQGQ